MTTAVYAIVIIILTVLVLVLMTVSYFNNRSREQVLARLGMDKVPNPVGVVWKALSSYLEKLNEQGRYDEAFKTAEDSLFAAKRLFGNNHIQVADMLNNLASVYKSQKKYFEAEPIYSEALRVWKAALGDDHPDVATCLNNMGELYVMQGKYSDAEASYRKALEIFERLIKDRKPVAPERYLTSISVVLDNLSEVYRRSGQKDESVKYKERAKEIRLIASN